ncbi:MAG: hypothetical protein KF810_15990 [Rhizobiaceae bacterium]|nr:hypothetical protein [Rhizobiaceae bacterium]
MINANVIPFSSDQAIKPHTDEALALAFASRHAGHVRYVAQWGRWFLYNGSAWAPDHTLQVFSFGRALCRDEAAVAPDGARSRILSAKTFAAVVSMARSDPSIAATVDQWDTNLFALNCNGEAVMLDGDTRRPAIAGDYFTKSTTVRPDGDCPLWLKFLKTVTDGDDALLAYLQRVCGYCLTGSTAEHVLFFLHGTGANGKSVFLSTIAGIMGDYARTAPIETFTATNIDRHPTDLAGLAGARLVTATETQEGRRWDETRIKTLTGGDIISARFMRQDFFDFLPQFKLVIAGNHKPSLRSIDEAISRRFHLIPFTVTIPTEERDPDLADKLKDEWPGILRWMIEGCRDWRVLGLHPPAVVLNATTAYLDAEDSIATWMEECVECVNDGFASRSSLYDSWKSWCERSGEVAGTRKQLVQILDSREGIQPLKRAGIRGYLGLRIVSTQSQPGDSQ